MSTTSNVTSSILKPTNIQKSDSREISKDQNDKDPQITNIIAAKAVADAIRTSLGPRGMDKMIVGGTDSSILITNDGATILKKLEVTHPTAKMLVELSKAQDIEAGDGTTSVVVICGALLNACRKLLLQGIHPTIISDAFGICGEKACEILEKTMAIPLDISDRDSLIKSAMTSLSSKVVSQYAEKLGPLAVDAVLSILETSLQTKNEEDKKKENELKKELTIINNNTITTSLSSSTTINDNKIKKNDIPTSTTTTTTTTTTENIEKINENNNIKQQQQQQQQQEQQKTLLSTSPPIKYEYKQTNVDLNDIKIVKKLGGTLDDTELVDGIVFTHGAVKSAGGPTRMKNAKIALIQFHLSPPKTDMDNNIIINDSSQIDRILREERNYLIDLCNRIKKSGCNVLLIQKSILRDATTEMSLHFLSKMKIMVIQDIERNDIEFISKTLNCKPIAHIDSFKPEKFGYANLVEEIDFGTVGDESGRVVKITGIKNKGKTITILCRASNKLVLDETERSLHDALCVIRSLIKKRFLIAGGGAPEIELAVQLSKYANQLKGIQSVVCRSYADALEIIPTTLAENAGLKPIQIVTELRNRHSNGEFNTGISVKQGLIKDMVKEENVLQPLLVSLSEIQLATETVRMILKIDKIVDAI